MAQILDVFYDTNVLQSVAVIIITPIHIYILYMFNRIKYVVETSTDELSFPIGHYCSSKCICGVIFVLYLSRLLGGVTLCVPF